VIDLLDDEDFALDVAFRAMRARQARRVRVIFVYLLARRPVILPLQSGTRERPRLARASKDSGSSLLAPKH